MQFKQTMNLQLGPLACHAQDSRAISKGLQYRETCYRSAGRHFMERAAATMDTCPAGLAELFIFRLVYYQGHVCWWLSGLDA